MKYSLANYILSIEPTDSRIKNLFGTISIGGQGSAVGTIDLSIANDMFSTTGFATGGWVHNKSLDRTGTVSITINQLATAVGKFLQMSKLFYGEDYDGFTLTLSDIGGEKIASCIDCYIQAIPTQSFSKDAADQNWVFTCGQINFN